MIQFPKEEKKCLNSEIPVVGYCSKIKMNGAEVSPYFYSESLLNFFCSVSFRKKQIWHGNSAIIDSKFHFQFSESARAVIKFFLPSNHNLWLQIATDIKLLLLQLPKGEREFIKSRDFLKRHFVFIEKCFMLFFSRSAIQSWLETYAAEI